MTYRELIIRIKVPERVDPSLADPQDVAAEVVDTYNEDCRINAGKYSSAGSLGEVELIEARWGHEDVHLVDARTPEGVRAVKALLATVLGPDIPPAPRTRPRPEVTVSDSERPPYEMGPGSIYEMGDESDTHWTSLGAPKRNQTWPNRRFLDPETGEQGPVVDRRRRSVVKWGAGSESACCDIHRADPTDPGECGPIQ